MQTLGSGRGGHRGVRTQSYGGTGPRWPHPRTATASTSERAVSPIIAPTRCSNRVGPSSLAPSPVLTTLRRWAASVRFTSTLMSDHFFLTSACVRFSDPTRSHRLLLRFPDESVPKSTFLRASTSEISTSISLLVKFFFFPHLLHSFFLSFLIVQRGESQVQGSFKYDLHV